MCFNSHARGSRESGRSPRPPGITPAFSGRRATRGLRAPGAGRPGAFTLIELLTVIAMIAILATLLLTTVSSVKRKAREAICMSNLRQTAIALNLYIEDFGKRPPELAVLATSKYLGDGRVLICPADRTGSSLPEAVVPGTSVDTSQT